MLWRERCYLTFVSLELAPLSPRGLATIPKFIVKFYLNLVISDVMHCFEMRTANIDYFVGEDPLHGRQDREVQLPPPDSGVGAHLAKSWETSIKQALMPVPSHSSKYCKLSMSVLDNILVAELRFTGIVLESATIGKNP